jgi:hypothetical protein
VFDNGTSTDQSLNLTSLEVEEYVVTQVVLFLLFVVPVFAVCTITGVVVALDGNLKLVMKAPMISVLLGAILSGVSMSVYGLSHAAFPLKLIDLSTQQGSNIASSYIIAVSGLQRSLSILVLSVVVYRMVKYSEKNLSVTAVTVVTIVLWILPFLLLLPMVFNVLWDEPIPSDIYYYNTKLKGFGKFFPGLVVTLVEIPTKIVIVAVVVGIFRYTKKHVLSGKKETSKALGRFLLGMFIVNIFSSSVVLFSVIITAVEPDTRNDMFSLLVDAGIYFVLFSVTIPAPVILMCLFKTIPITLRDVLFSMCCCTQTKITVEAVDSRT